MHIPDGTIYRRAMFCMRILTDKTELIRVVDKLDREGGFARQLGKAALLADQDNLRKLVSAFPKLFIEGHGLRLVYECNNNLSERLGHQRGESRDIC